MSESTWLLLDHIGILLGLLAFVGSAYSAIMWLRHFRREKSLRHPIPIRLTTADRQSVRYELPWQPPRRLITRAEVLGLLGMIPSTEKGQRYEWQWLHQPDFMRELEQIHHGESDALAIPLSDEEYHQLSI